GFGLAGHMLEILQNSNLSAIIETIPSIKLSESLSKDLGYDFDECKCAETAGGMLMAVDPSRAEDFSDTLSSNRISNWFVGTIDTHTPGLVRISENVNNLEISKY
ncbi:MAG: hypothetical protein KAX18_13365, partial [Candidatus Lokiarchaeota archaeon]|nr:hypothetical protein [Candidatus Lokiarchaeota archaeon]